MSLHVADIKGTITSFLAEIGLADPEKIEAMDDLPEINTQQQLLLACYRSGQIEPGAWQAHLDRDPVRAAHFGAASRH